MTYPRFIDIARILYPGIVVSDPKLELEKQIAQQQDFVNALEDKGEEAKKELGKAQRLLTGLQSKLEHIDSQIEKDRIRALQGLGIFDHRREIEQLESEIDKLKAEIDKLPEPTEANPKLNTKITLKGNLETKQTKLLALQKAQDIEMAKLPRLQKFLAITQNSALGTKLFGESFAIADRSIFDDREIEAAFIKQNESLEYFSEDDGKIVSLYKEFYKLCYYNWVVIEGNANPEEVHDYAYKFMATFLEKGTLDKDKFYQTLDAFISGFCGNLSPMHDIFSNVQFPAYLSEVGNRLPAFDLPAWQKLINAHGMKVLREIGHAPNIQEPKTLIELEEAVKQFRYKRAGEHPDLAELCFKYKVAEARFNRALDLFNDGTIRPKTRDDLPNIAIDIAKVAGAESRENYYLLKLPAGDLRGLILGDITSCCQSIGGHSEMVAIDGSNLASNGFYVLVKCKQPIDIVQYHSDPEYYKGFWDNLEERGHKILGQ